MYRVRNISSNEVFEYKHENEAYAETLRQAALDVAAARRGRYHGIANGKPWFVMFVYPNGTASITRMGIDRKLLILK
jgi:hypothetical protein